MGKSSQTGNDGRGFSDTKSQPSKRTLIDKKAAASAARELTSTPWDGLLETHNDVMVVKSLLGSELGPARGTMDGLPLSAELLRAAAIQRSQLYSKNWEEEEMKNAKQQCFSRAGKEDDGRLISGNSSVKRQKISHDGNTERSTQRNTERHTSHTSRFRGVCWYKRTNRWVVQLKVRGIRRHIGYFEDEVLAAEAYDRALKEVREEELAANKEQNQGGQSPSNK